MLTETTGTRIAARVSNEIRDQHDGDLHPLITQTIARVVDAEVNELLDVLERVIATRVTPELDEFDGDLDELVRAVEAHEAARGLLYRHGR